MACPSCALARFGISLGTQWLINGVCVLFALAALGVLFWGIKSGLLKDTEAVKYRMLMAEEDFPAAFSQEERESQVYLLEKDDLRR